MDSTYNGYISAVLTVRIYGSIPRNKQQRFYDLNNEINIMGIRQLRHVGPDVQAIYKENKRVNEVQRDDKVNHQI